jgi:hypothetical protein
MFTTTINSSWDERSRRGFTTLTSFAAQALLAGVLLILPLLRPAGLPSLRPLSTPLSLGRPMTEPAAVTALPNESTAAPTNPAIIFLRPSPRLSRGMQTATDDGPPQISQSGPGIPGPFGPGS